MTRLLGVQIANGFSPEAQVFAQLLKYRDTSRVEAHILHHALKENMDGLARFGAASGDATHIQPLDFGWRLPVAGRGIAEKIYAQTDFLRALPRAARIAKRIAPDVIYSCQQLWDCRAATYIARRLRKPQIIHLHYIVGPWLHKPILKRLLTCDHVVTISNFIQDEALRHGVAPERATIVRNAIEMPPVSIEATRAEILRELHIAPGSLVFGIVARLDPDKGQADTIRAFAKLIAPERPDACLLVVGGETPWRAGYERILKDLANDLGLSDKQIRFLGRRDDVLSVLAAINIFVHPSRKEPFGLAVLEASAAGLPVIAYAEGGACETVVDGVTGALAKPGDVADLAAQMKRLADDPALAHAQGAAGRERAEREFDPQSAGAALTCVIEQVAGVSAMSPITALAL